MTILHCPQAGHALFRKQQVVGQYLRSLQQIQHRVGADVFGGEWQKKSQGCFTRRVMLPSTGQGPTCRGAGLSRWVSAIFTAMPFQGEGSTMLGSTCSLGNLHVFESGKHFPTIRWSFSYLNASCDLHWLSLLAVTQERFTCHIATGGLTVVSILTYGCSMVDTWPSNTKKMHWAKVSWNV